MPDFDFIINDDDLDSIAENTGNILNEHLKEVGRKNLEMIDKMCGAYLAMTNIPPSEVILLHDYDLKTGRSVWYFDTKDKHPVQVNNATPFNI